MSDKTIVIVTKEIDAHADAMLIYLQEQGYEVFRLHPHELALQIESSVEIDSNRTFACWVKSRGIGRKVEGW